MAAAGELDLSLAMDVCQVLEHTAEELLMVMEWEQRQWDATDCCQLPQPTETETAGEIAAAEPAYHNSLSEASLAQAAHTCLLADQQMDSVY